MSSLTILAVIAGAYLYLYLGYLLGRYSWKIYWKNNGVPDTVVGWIFWPFSRINDCDIALLGGVFSDDLKNRRVYLMLSAVFRGPQIAMNLFVLAIVLVAKWLFWPFAATAKKFFF